MISTLFKTGKHLMIFAAVCIVAGIILFVFFDEMKHSNTFNRKLILHWCIKHLGRYGFPGFFIGAGMIVGLRGYFQHRSEKQERQPH